MSSEMCMIYEDMAALGQILVFKFESRTVREGRAGIAGSASRREATMNNQQQQLQQLSLFRGRLIRAISLSLTLPFPRNMKVSEYKNVRPHFGHMGTPTQVNFKTYLLSDMSQNMRNV